MAPRRKNIKPDSLRRSKRIQEKVENNTFLDTLKNIYGKIFNRNDPVEELDSEIVESYDPRPDPLYKDRLLHIYLDSVSGKSEYKDYQSMHSTMLNDPPVLDSKINRKSAPIFIHPILEDSFITYKKARSLGLLKEKIVFRKRPVVFTTHSLCMYCGCLSNVRIVTQNGLTIHLDFVVLDKGVKIDMTDHQLTLGSVGLHKIQAMQSFLYKGESGLHIEDVTKLDKEKRGLFRQSLYKTEIKGRLKKSRWGAHPVWLGINPAKRHNYLSHRISRQIGLGPKYKKPINAEIHLCSKISVFTEFYCRTLEMYNFQLGRNFFWENKAVINYHKRDMRIYDYDSERCLKVRCKGRFIRKI